MDAQKLCVEVWCARAERRLGQPECDSRIPRRSLGEPGCDSPILGQRFVEPRHRSTNFQRSLGEPINHSTNSQQSLGEPKHRSTNSQQSLREPRRHSHIHRRSLREPGQHSRILCPACPPYTTQYSPQKKSQAHSGLTLSKNLSKTTRPRLLELGLIQISVEAALCHQFVVVTVFYDIALIHHNNSIGVANR